jgi:hypothetical protein
VDRGQWFVRYSIRVPQQDGSIKLQQKAKKLGTVDKYPLESQIKPLQTEFMYRINAGTFTADSGIRLQEFEFTCHGRKKGVELSDYTSGKLTVNRSVWRSVARAAHVPRDSGVLNGICTI